MSTIQVNFTTKSQDFPAGTTPAGFQVTATAQAAGKTVSQTVTTTTCEFANAQPDTYSVTVQLVDAAGAPLGAPASASIVVQAPSTISLQVPDTLSLAVV